MTGEPGAAPGDSPAVAPPDPPPDDPADAGPGDSQAVAPPDPQAVAPPDPPFDDPADAGPGEPPYHLRYTVTADAFIDAARLAQSAMRTRILVLAAVAAVAGLVLLVLDPTTPGLMLVFFGVIMVTLTVPRGPERWLIERRGRSVLGTEVEVSIGRLGVAVQTVAIEGRIAWTALTDVREDGRTVIFLRDRILQTYVPAAAFGSAERRTEIVGFARARITSARPPA